MRPFRRKVSLTLTLCFAFVWAPAAGTSTAQGAESTSQVVHSAVMSVDRGFVFINGQYLSLPYIMEQNRETITINGVDLRREGIDLDSNRLGIAELCRSLRGWLGERNVLVLNKESRPVLLSRVHGGFEYLKLLDQHGIISDDETPELCKSIEGKSLGIETWQKHADQFVATAEFSRRFADEVALIERVETDQDEVLAVLWWEKWLSYPLTIGMMMLIVFSCGHLLSYRPQDLVNPSSAGLMLDTDTIIRSNLGIVFVFSLLDLLWTLGASARGTMSELNPIGLEFISSPLALTAFKLTLTGGAVAILYMLRDWPLARRASWWACLFLTLLAGRWVMFNSMFMAG